MTKIPGWALALMTTLSLAGCGGSGGSSSATAASGDVGSYYPLAVGDRWVYQETDSNTGTATVTQSVRLFKASGTVTVNGIDTIALQASGPATGTVLDEAHLAMTPQALQRLYQAADGAPEQYEGAVTLLRLPVRSGDSYVAQDQSGIDLGVDLDGDGHDETLALHTNVTISGPESVTVAAGSFSNAMKASSVTTRTITYSKNNAQSVVTLTDTEWLAPDIGPVKIVQTYNVPNYSATTEYDLSEYRVGGQASETVAPAVTQTLPADTGIAGGGATISLTASELLDVTGADAPVLTVLNGGQPVAGTLGYSNGTLTFTPTQPLASGDYTATLSAATDAAGNGLAGDYSWSFTIDAAPPVVTATSPANASTKVAINAGISIDFSKAMDPASFTAGSVTLTGGTANALTATVTGNHVALLPASALDLGTTYTVTVSGNVRDTLGNAMGSSYSFSFTTVPPRFLSYHATATGSWPQAVAIGDVNGDGRNDVVMVTSCYASSPNDNKVMIFAQKPDGTLDAPVTYDISATASCGAYSVAIGDVTGDGRNDVIVGENGNGIEVLAQQPDGTLASTGVLASSNARQIRVGDVNNDGRLDVIGVGWASGSVSVWTQKVGGGLNGATNYTLAHAGYEDLAIGDVTGDGLNDIVVSSGQGDNTKNISVLPQAAGGGFGTPTYYGTSGISNGAFTNVAGVAVGDINHDGRADIVLSIGGNRPYSKLGIMYQQTDGSLGAITLKDSYDIPQPVQIADVDQDGRNDIVVAHGGWDEMGLYLQDSSGQLVNEKLFGTPYASSYNPDGLALGDINGDGYPDAVIADSNNGLVVLYNSGP